MTETMDPRTLTQGDLAILGLPDMAYVKPVQSRGATAHAICAADGTELAVVEGRDLAFAVARQNDLEPVSVH